jgi:hypothetical protein
MVMLQMTRFCENLHLYKSDENVATVPFNVPFKYHHLKVDSAKIALAMNQKSWRSYYPLLFVVE